MDFLVSGVRSKFGAIIVLKSNTRIFKKSGGHLVTVDASFGKTARIKTSERAFVVEMGRFSQHTDIFWLA